jgi:hypothetical protein
MKIHIKGFILQALVRQPGLWDVELTRRICREYRKPEGAYWLGMVRASLADLSASGLVVALGERWRAEDARLLFNYRVSDFGLERMRQTGLA